MHAELLERLKTYPDHGEIEAGRFDEGNGIVIMAVLIGDGKRVLDLGCASGYLARLLSRHGCRTVGVDINPQAVEEASRVCVAAYTADLDQTRLTELLAEEPPFDVIVLGDILEHLREPLRVLEETRGLLVEGGYVVASIPNVAHGAVRLALLAGAFDYQELGILDASHLRFFTSKSIEELFLGAGLRIAHLERTKQPVFGTSELVPKLEVSDFDPNIVAQVLADDPECETMQFILQAFPLADEARGRAISGRFLAVNTELAVERRRLAQRERELERERGLRLERERELEEARLHLRHADEEMRRAQQLSRDVQDELRPSLEARALLEEARGERDRLRLECETLSQRLEGIEQRTRVMEGERGRLTERAERLAAELEALRTSAERSRHAEIAFARSEERAHALGARLRQPSGRSKSSGSRRPRP